MQAFENDNTELFGDCRSINSKRTYTKKPDSKATTSFRKTIDSKPKSVIKELTKTPVIKELIKFQSKSLEYLNKTESNRQENLKNLEYQRKNEKIKAFQRCLTLIKNGKFNNTFLAHLNKVPLVSQEMIESNEISEYYDEEEYEWAKQKLIDSNPNESMRYYPSVSTILSVGDDKKYEFLLKWKLDEMDRLGYQGFLDKNEETKQKGTDFHNAVENILRKQPLPDYKTNINKSIESLQKLLKDDFDNKYVLIESKVCHNQLAYQGRIDCLAYYKNELCLIDWKRSDKPKEDKSSLFEYPVQLAAYLGAFLNDPLLKEIREAHEIQNTLVVNVSDDGEVNFHLFNYQQMEFYWYKWLSTYKNFWYSALQFDKEKKI